MPRRRRRPKGMTKRPESRFYQYDRRFPGRGRVKRSLGTEDYNTACDRADDINRRLESGLRFPARHRFDAVWPQFREELLEGRKNENDRQTLKQRAKDYIEPFFGAVDLEAIDPPTLTRFKRDLQTRTGVRGRPLSPTTVWHVQGVVMQFSRWCVGQGYLERSPVPPRWRKKPTRNKPLWLKPEDADAVCSLPDLIGFACRFFRATGLRYSEGYRLEASAIDFQARRITVRQSKGEDREVPLEGPIFDEVHARFGRGYVGRVMPFLPKESSGFNRSVVRASGVAGFTAHRLRHTFAREWLNRGGSPGALQEIMGHKDYSTTRLYGRPSEDAIQQEVKKVHSATTSATSGRVEAM